MANSGLKTIDVGSTPATPVELWPGCGEVVNASDCGSDIVGSIPIIRLFNGL